MTYEQDPDQVDEEEANVMWESWQEQEQEQEQDYMKEEWFESQYRENMEQICALYDQGETTLEQFKEDRKEIARSIARRVPPRNPQDLRYGFNCAVYNRVLELTEIERVKRELQDEKYGLGLSFLNLNSPQDVETAGNWLMHYSLVNEKIGLLGCNDQDNSINLPSL